MEPAVHPEYYAHQHHKNEPPQPLLLDETTPLQVQMARQKEDERKLVKNAALVIDAAVVQYL
jgi:hypothetical protein